ncbi:MAG: SDR family oxidoreductase [Microbacterium sp.]
MVGADTGAIGSVLADGLAARGAVVVRSGRSAASPGSVRLDIADPDSVQRGVADAAEILGGLDAVVNAAGITAQTPSLETPLDEWNRVVAVNLTGSFLVAQAAANVMVAPANGTAGGSVVLISSLCARVGCDSVAAYAASKAGVEGLARSLAAEWGPIGVRVNTVTPGVFVTPLNESRVNGTTRGSNSKQRTPLGRFGDTSELVGAVALLVGSDGSFITGTDIAVDGGFLASGIHGREAHPVTALSYPEDADDD